MLLLFGIIAVVWGLIELHAGSAWFISRFGVARYTQEDDGFIFQAVAWCKIIGGALWIGRHI